MKKALLALAALLACGSVLLSQATLAPGQTAEYADGCAMTLLDYSAARALIELDCGQATQTFIALNETLEYAGTRITLQSVNQGNATFSFAPAARKKIASDAEALEAAKAFVSRYPPQSVIVERGVDCDGLRGTGYCWAVSGHETVRAAATNETPAYERFAGATAFVDGYGSVVRLVTVT